MDASQGHVRQVCLRQNYCEWCCKSKLGKSSGIWVPSDSERVDQIQAMHTAHNGLLLLDMETPGEECENKDQCGVVCLVCGQNMAKDIPGVVALQEIVEKTREYMLEFNNEVDRGLFRFSAEAMRKGMASGLRKTLSKYDAVWAAQWDRPIHTACAKETACNCMVPLGEKKCKEHNKGLKTGPRVFKKPRNTPTMAPQAAPPAKKKAVAMPVTKKEAVISRVTWLKPMSSTAKVVGGAGIQKQQGAQKQKVKPVEHKPNLKLQEAAKTCAFKLDSWTSASPDAKAVSDTGASKKGSFSLEGHYKNFDTFTHGYIWGKDGRLAYIRGDGVRVHAECGVNELTESGEMIPKC